MLNKSSIAIMALLGVTQQTQLHSHAYDDNNTDTVVTTVPEVPTAEVTLDALGGSNAAPAA